MVLNDNGVPAQSQEEAEAIWIRHFSSLEAGRVASPVDLAGKCMARQSRRELEELCIDRHDFPSRCELESSLRSTQTGRAQGVDGLPGEILRMAEPLHFKGGALQTVWKGKLSPAKVEAHRGILVSSCIGKSLHRALRCRAVEPLQQVSSPLQLGGLPRRPVVMASHAIRMFQQGAQSRRHSYSLVFLDLREAFYRVIRPLVTGSRFNDEDYAKIASTLGLPSDTLAVLHRHMQEGSLPQLAGASAWAAMSLSEILDCTWFRFRRSESIVETGVGSRPGDNCADLVFSYLFACVLKDLREELHREGVLACFPWAESMMGQVGQVDPSGGATSQLPDLSMMLRTSKADSLVDTTERATRSLLDHCMSRGLVPNLDRGQNRDHFCAYRPRITGSPSRGLP